MILVDDLTGLSLGVLLSDIADDQRDLEDAYPPFETFLKEKGTFRDGRWTYPPLKPLGRR